MYVYLISITLLTVAFLSFISLLVRRIIVSSKEVLETFNPMAHHRIEEGFENLPSSFQGSYCAPIHSSNSTNSNSSDLEVDDDVGQGGIDNTFSFEVVPEPLTISFKGLNLLLKKNCKKLLTNISCVVNHHEITALMGPSGAGELIYIHVLYM